MSKRQDELPGLGEKHMQFSKRMDQFGDSIFAKLLEIKHRKVENGEPVIDLSIGTPNIPPSKHIMDALCAAAADERNYVYAINDQNALLDAVSYWYKKRYNVELNPKTEICSLLGSQEGFAHVAMTLVNEDDLVLVPDPCYPIFADGPKMVGANLYYMPQKEENNYLIQLSDIPQEIANRAKLMIVSYPNNPTAVMAPDCFYHELIAFARKYDIVVLYDNAYSELVFDNKRCESFLSYPGAREVGVEFNSLSKTYGLAGARIGFCLGNHEIVAKLKMVKSNLDYGMFIPIQKAAIAAVTGNQNCVKETRNAYEIRRNVLCNGLNAIGWKVDKSEATMFVWAKIPKGYSDCASFAMELVERAGVLVTPGSAFGPSGEGFVRIALVQGEETLNRAVNAIKESKILIRE